MEKYDPYLFIVVDVSCFKPLGGSIGSAIQPSLTPVTGGVQNMCSERILM